MSDPTPVAPPRWRIVRECEYARATAAALALGMTVHRRGDLLHLRVGGRWHALALVPGSRLGPAAGRRWVAFELDLQSWFAFGRGAARDVPPGSGWGAVHWLASAA